LSPRWPNSWSTHHEKDLAPLHPLLAQRSWIPPPSSGSPASRTIATSARSAMPEASPLSFQILMEAQNESPTISKNSMGSCFQAVPTSLPRNMERKHTKRSESSMTPAFSLKRPSAEPGFSNQRNPFSASASAASGSTSPVEDHSFKTSPPNSE